MNHTAHRNHIWPSLLQSSERRLCHVVNTALGAPPQVLLFFRGWSLSPSFSLFGWGDAAVHLPAGLAESPLIPFGTQVGTVPATNALKLPIPCDGREREVGYKRKCQTPWESRAPEVISLLAPGWY